MTTFCSVTELLHRQAVATPNRVAVSGDPAVSATAELSYADLLSGTQARAGALRQAGALAGDVVGVALASDVAMAQWLAAIAWAGCVGMPLSPTVPAGRLAAIEAAAPRFIIAEAPLCAGSMASHRITPAELAAGQRGQLMREPFPVTGTCAAYCCFTSGSTGTPRATAVTHRGIASVSAALTAAMPHGEAGKHLVLSPWHFDVAMADLWMCLTRGHTLLVDRRDRGTGSDLARVLADDKVTFLQCVTTYIDSIPAADLHGHPAGLTLILGGQSLAPQVLARLPAHWNVALTYGVTEASVSTTLAVLGARRTCADRLIGGSLPGAQCYVVDEQLRPVPPGADGELLIGGDGVAQAYLADPAATARRFVPDGISGTPGARLYRSGDMVRELPDGDLAFAGRLDDQVKVRGFRIEPAEVEAALRRHRDIEIAAVCARTDPGGDYQLVGYVPVSGPDEAALRRHLADLVPDYMIPTAWVRMTAWPRTATEKVDRKQLPDPDWRRERWPRHSGQAHADAEQQVAEIWQDVLGVAEVSGADNFFDLGGHSLKAVKIVDRLREATGRHVPIAEVMRSETLSDLASFVASGRAEAAEGPIVAPGQVTALQRGIWLTENLAGEDAISSIPVVIRLRGPLSVPALERALSLAAVRHPALRTTITFAAGELRADVTEPCRVTLTAEQAAGPGYAELITAITDAEAKAGLDVARGPAWRQRLIRLDTGDHVLALTFHHALVDGIAVSKVISDIAGFYSDVMAKGAAAVSTEPQLMTARLPSAARVSADIDYWRAALTNAPQFVSLPGSRPRPRRPDFAGLAADVTISAPVADLAGDLARQHRISLQAVLLAAFARVISRRAGAEQVVIGVDVSLRDIYRVPPDAVSQFTTTLPVIVPSDPRRDLRAGLAAAHDGLMNTLDHRSADADTLIRNLDMVRQPGYTGLTQLVFSYEEQPAAPVFAGLTSSWEVLFNGWSLSDLNLQLRSREHAGGLDGRLVCSAALFDRAAAAEVLGDLCGELGGIAVSGGTADAGDAT